MSICCSLKMLRKRLMLKLLIWTCFDSWTGSDISVKDASPKNNFSHLNKHVLLMVGYWGFELVAEQSKFNTECLRHWLTNQDGLSLSHALRMVSCWIQTVFTAPPLLYVYPKKWCAWNQNIMLSYLHQAHKCKVKNTCLPHLLWIFIMIINLNNHEKHPFSSW